ncbi:MAG: sugar phosphate isomerase/epimerase [Planctomycetes bacterium]|nr:sugar phosphate isomerase/epimerase [Planctomycetota bacterium]
MANAESERLTRRGFLEAAGAAAGLGALGAGVARAAESAGGADPIRIGSVAWNFRGIGSGPPWDDAIRMTAELGLVGIELIVARAEELDSYWKEPELSRIRAMAEKLGVALPQFVLFQNAAAGLGSRKAEVRARALDDFEKGCKVARVLGSPMINIVAPWVEGLVGNSPYLPRYFSVPDGRKDVFRIRIPEDFDFPAIWEEFVATVKGATERAKAHGLRFSLENHTHTLIPDTDAFLRLWDRIRDPALGMNLDIGWIFVGREYPAISVLKVKDHLVNVHIRDIDGSARIFVGLGSGTMDFEGVIRALRRIGYKGFVTFEQDGVKDMRRTILDGKSIIERLLRANPPR